MRYFFDTEFLEDGEKIKLISIGVVCEDGREYYAVNYLAPFYEIIQHQPWLKENVLPHVGFNKPADTEWIDFYLNSGLNNEMTDRREVFKMPDEIKADLIAFVAGDDIEFWAYYGDYDWVCLCQMFGRMIDKPTHWPMFAYDLRQQLNNVGLSGITQSDDAPHNALEDARWVRDTYMLYGYGVEAAS